MTDETLTSRGDSAPQRQRLESWKEIAAYLGRDVRTAQRWERCEALPVHRLHHHKLGSIYAYTSELDAWREARRARHGADRPAAAHTLLLPKRGAWTLAGVCLLILAIAAAFARVDSRNLAGGAELRVSSLAVLPLGDYSRDPDAAYFADGMTDALIRRLAALRDLRVSSRTSVMPFKDTRTPLAEIAEALNVDAIIEGSVLRSGDRVRITVTLVRVDTGETLWSGSYDRHLMDVLALQREVAQAIAVQIEARTHPTERAGPAATQAVEPAVYDSYLRGLFHLHGGTRTVGESLRYFEQAIDRDPTFAPAYAGLAAAYQVSGSTSVGLLPVADVHPSAVTAARKALELEPRLAQAHVILAFAHQQQWQWLEGEAGYRRAIEIDPNGPDAYSGLGALLTWLGRADDGLAYARHAREIDPLSPGRTVELAWLLYHARQYDEAIRELRTVLAAEPDHVHASWTLGFALIDSLQFEEAIRIIERLVVVWDRNPAALGLLARVYGRAGDAARALQLLDELTQRERMGYVPPAVFVNAYVGLGDHENAFTALERAFEERSNIVQFLRTHPLYDPLRADPRFAELLRRARLD